MRSRANIRGVLAGVIALVACPCHLPLTLPILLAVTAGTAMSGWLVSNSATVYIASVIIFAGSIYLSARWLLSGEKRPSTSVKNIGS